MNSQGRSLLAAALSLLILIGWFYFFGSGPTPPVATPAPTAAPAPETTAAAPVSVPTPAKPKVSLEAERHLTRETDLQSLGWTNRGATLEKVFLKKYRQDVRKESPPISLVSPEGDRPLEILCDPCNAPLPEADTYRLVSESETSVVFEATNGPLVVRKEYEWKKDHYLLGLKVTVENLSETQFQGRLGLGWAARQHPSGPKGMLDFLKGPGNRRTLLYKLGTKVEHLGEKQESSQVQGMIPWGGIEDRYFLISLVARRVSSDQLLRYREGEKQVELSLFPGAITIPAGGKHEEAYSVYLGPKSRDALKIAGVGLEEAVDYGWFSVLAIPILKLLQIFHMGVRNWGLAVIVLTLFAKLLMNPLTIKSMRQMKEMQKLQPKLAELKEKYKNDKQRLNMETMALFRTHKVNPMGGCLPMILQMPIYIALYKVLYNSIELYHAPFVGFYRDLSAPDPYFILPILLGISMVAQQKLTPTPSADPAQKQMMMIMPVMFTAFMLFLPLGLVLYIFVNTVASVLQQWMNQRDLRWRDLFRRRFFSPPPR